MGCLKTTYKKNEILLKVVHSKTPFFLLAGDKQKPYRTKKRLNDYQYKYNGVELQDELDLNLYSMDFRQYDPAIGRFTSIDPITHHSMSPYNAFDNNPIYFADPSGADAEGLIDDLWNSSGAGSTTWTNNGNGTFNGSNGESVDYAYNSSEGEMNAIATDLNDIYKEKYGESPFSVEKKTGTYQRKVKDAFWPWQDDIFEEYKYEVYILAGSIAFNWQKDPYTKMLRDVLDSDEFILTDIVNDTKKGYSGGMFYETGNGLLSDAGGGVTRANNAINISVELKYFRNVHSRQYTIGGVFLHEVLFHIHPNGALEKNVQTLQNHYGLLTSPNHKGLGRLRNQKINH